MAQSRGPFRATEADVPRVREYLRERGIEYRGNSPEQARRIGNAVAKQEAAGLIANRPAARGHGSTPEHPGRKPTTFKPPQSEREQQPAAAGKELKIGTQREYQRVHYSIPQEQRYQQFPDGQEIYRTTSGNRASAIVRFEASAYEGKRIDIEVTYADGTKQRLFTGADHKRNGEHAIDAKVLEEMLEDYDGDWDDFIADYADDDAYSDDQGGGGVVAYSINVY